MEAAVFWMFPKFCYSVHPYSFFYSGVWIAHPPYLCHIHRWVVYSVYFFFFIVYLQYDCQAAVTITRYDIADYQIVSGCFFEEFSEAHNVYTGVLQIWKIFSGIENVLNTAHTAYVTNGTYIPGTGVGGYPI